MATSGSWTAAFNMLFADIAAMLRVHQPADQAGRGRDKRTPRGISNILFPNGNHFSISSAIAFASSQAMSSLVFFISFFFFVDSMTTSPSWYSPPPVYPRSGRRNVHLVDRGDFRHPLFPSVGSLSRVLFELVGFDWEGSFLFPRPTASPQDICSGRGRGLADSPVDMSANGVLQERLDSGKTLLLLFP